MSTIHLLFVDTIPAGKPMPCNQQNIKTTNQKIGNQQK
jgi:hypothetical protein